jgi:hypothetical protein
VTTPISTTTPGSNRNRLVLFGALGVVVLLAALVLPRVLFGGGGDDDLGAPPDVSGSSGSTTTTTTEGDDLASVPPPEAFSTKNPFIPLVDPTPAATTPGTGPTDGSTPAPAGDVATDTTGTGTGTDSGAGAGTGTGTGTGTGSTEPASGRFSLIDVYAGAGGNAVATVEVDGQMYTVAEGDTFAGGYTVVSLSLENKTGVFTSASDGSTFTPNAGESVLK